MQGPEGEVYAEEGQPVYNEEGGIVCYIGKGGGGSWQVKGKGKGQNGRFKGQCWICGKQDTAAAIVGSREKEKDI